MNGAQFSAINSLRTGNVVLDMMIAMIIPVIFRIIFTDGKSMLEKISAWLFGKATTIYGGSTEIQNNIIAKRVLGMLDHQ